MGVPCPLSLQKITARPQKKCGVIPAPREEVAVAALETAVVVGLETDQGPDREIKGVGVDPDREADGMTEDLVVPVDHETARETARETAQGTGAGL